MSEQVEYIFNFENIKEKQKDEVLELIANAGLGEVNDESYNNTFCLIIEDGWRGGGRSCNEILSDVLDEWCNNNKNVSVNVEVRYIEHAPIITEYSKDTEVQQDE